jgi:hypothetical protein
MFAQQTEDILGQVDLMLIVQKVVCSRVVKDIAVDILSSSPFLIDELVHDLGVKDLKHLVLFHVPKAVIPVDVESFHERDHLFRFFVNF